MTGRVYNGRVVLVTRAAAGIGRELALGLAEQFPKSG
jgi:NAD(P)-dependent dehydrogenase (short-subunit alcohol dehydrogenase family)